MCCCFHAVCTDEDLTATLFNDAVCSPEYGQPLVDKFLQCGDEESAGYYASLCGKSADGTLCTYYRYTQWLDSHSCNCPHIHCTRDCGDALEIYRDDTKCCLSAVRSSLDDYHMWEEYCGLEPPVLCNDSTLTLTPPENPQSCEDGFQQRLIYTDFYCTAAGQSIVDTLTECGHDDATLLVNFCGTNEHGAQCLDVAFDVSDNAVSECNSVADSCTANCSASLELLRDQYGCCAYPALTTLLHSDRNLWSLCNVEAPGVCSESTLVIHSVDEVTPKPDENPTPEGIYNICIMYLGGVVLCLRVHAAL